MKKISNFSRERSSALANRLFISLLALLLAAAPLACTKKESAPVDPHTALVTRGRAIYQANCTACHNPDPRKPGSIGPDVFGSSRELIEARVMRAEYPPGYAPKRATHAMVPLPQLKGELDAIHAYLNEGK